MPGAFANASLNVFVVFTNSSVLIAVALKAELRVLLKTLPTTTTSASSVVGFNFAVSFVRSPAFICTVNSLDS